jgi:hypothetical protein
MAPRPNQVAFLAAAAVVAAAVHQQPQALQQVQLLVPLPLVEVQLVQAQAAAAEQMSAVQAFLKLVSAVSELPSLQMPHDTSDEAVGAFSATLSVAVQPQDCPTLAGRHMRQQKHAAGNFDQAGRGCASNLAPAASATAVDCCYGRPEQTKAWQLFSCCPGLPY